MFTLHHFSIKKNWFMQKSVKMSLESSSSFYSLKVCEWFHLRFRIFCYWCITFWCENVEHPEKLQINWYNILFKGITFKGNKYTNISLYSNRNVVSGICETGWWYVYTVRSKENLTVCYPIKLKFSHLKSNHRVWWIFDSNFISHIFVGHVENWDAAKT